MPEVSAPAATGRGIGRTLVAVYAVFALSSVGRSSVQLLTKADDAPVPYALSGFAALVYVVATVALARGGIRWWRVAVVACLVELVGVLAVGTASLLLPEEFPDATVWSGFGIGYAFFPLVLPFVGLWWLHRTRPSAT
ncbi:MAG: hypothetical protein Q8Q02_13550 [Nocardioides sp.]|nr:hypothetical protein [Nocardioides sp.]